MREERGACTENTSHADVWTNTGDPTCTEGRGGTTTRKADWLAFPLPVCNKRSRRQSQKEARHKQTGGHLCTSAGHKGSSPPSHLGQVLLRHHLHMSGVTASSTLHPPGFLRPLYCHVPWHLAMCHCAALSIPFIVCPAPSPEERRFHKHMDSMSSRSWCFPNS